MAQWAGCPHHLIIYDQPSAAFAADSFVMSEAMGAGSGLWLGSLSRSARSYGDVMVYGFMEDPLSGNYDQFRSFDSLIYDVFISQYEYTTDVAAFMTGLFDRSLEQKLAGYAQTFERYRAMDSLFDVYLMQRLNEKHYRRVLTAFGSGTKLGLPPSDPAFDRRIAQVYLQLPSHLLQNQRFHNRLGYLARPQLGLLSPYLPLPVPQAIAPVLLPWPPPNGYQMGELASASSAAAENNESGCG